MTLRKNRGFSLLELLATIAIGFTVAAISFMSLQPLLTRSHIDVAYDTTLMALRNTRHLAITQSHEYVITFAPAGTITIQYQGPPDPTTGVIPALQLVNTYTLPSDVSFAVQTGFPTNAPDSFGTGAAAIDFGYFPPSGTGGSKQVAFMPDGSARDLVGNYNGGVVYLTRPTADKYSSRAITVWGATGRIRGWRLYKQAADIWVQQ